MTLCAITGAADGIGRALAFAFGRHGHRILGIDRDVERAEATRKELEAAGIEARFLTCDLADPDAIAAAAEQIAVGDPLDILVNNAGISEVSRFATSYYARHARVVDVNFMAPLLLTADLLGRGHLRDGGQLVFVSSLSRFVGYPGAAGYAASKDGVAAYARSLSVELAPRKISVLTVYPGPTRTVHARRYSPPNADESRRMLPEELARRIVATSARRQRRLIPGMGNRVFAALGHVAPRLTEAAMKRALFDGLD